MNQPILRPKTLIPLMAVLVCLLVVVLLLVNPVGRGDQIQGVSIQQGYVVDGGESVDLPEDLRSQIAQLLAETKLGTFTAVDSYTPPEGAVVLSDGNNGTEYILTPEDPSLLTRVNHDGYTSLRKQTELPESFVTSPQLAAFWSGVADYLSSEGEETPAE